jgi:integrase
MGEKPNSRGLFRSVISYQGTKYQVSAKSKKELARKVAQKEIDLESGNLVINNNTTVKRWCDEWLEVYKKPNVGVRHYDNTESIVRLHIKPEIGMLKLTDIKKIHLQKLFNAHKDKSFSHVSKIRSCLYEIFEAAVDEELIVKNPAKKLTLPNCTKGERIVFNDIEYNACFELAKTHKAGLWVVMMLTCGLRPQETVPLLWSDIDLKERTINIDKAVYFKGNKANLKGTKSYAGNRVVGINDDLYNLLISNKKENEKSLYVFARENGSMHSLQSLSALFKNFKRELDIMLGATVYRNQIKESKLQDKLTAYSCRHTCITKLVLNGLDVKTVQVFAGHEKPETTLKYYTHLDKNTAAKRVLEFQSRNIENVTKGVTKPQ